MTTQINTYIRLNMTETKTNQEKKKNERWNGYKIAVIKDSESALEKLEEIRQKKKGAQNSTFG
jgi:hypothetical protein